MIAAYRQPGAETEEHSRFIALSAEIKEARDLLAAGRTDGALLAALEARRRLEEIAGSGPASDPAALRGRAAEIRRELDRIGPDRTGPAAPLLLGLSAALAFAAAAATAQAADPQVTVTLLRWPYT